MSSSILNQLVHSARSIPGYDEHGVHEFNEAGPFQSKSWYCLVALFLISVVYAVAMILGFGHIFAWVPYLVLAVSIVMLSSLAVIIPSVKKQCSWELSRWIKAHMYLYASCVIIALVAIIAW